MSSYQLFVHLDYDVHYDAYIDVTMFKKTRLRLNRIGQMIGMNTVNLSVVSKLIFAFQPENICVSV